MKKVAQLIKEGNKSPIPTKIDNLEPHKLNLNMNYRGGKRGRKSDAERKILNEQLKFKSKNKTIYLPFN